MAAYSRVIKSVTGEAGFFRDTPAANILVAGLPSGF
jgi:hypothetical protein